MGYTGQKKNSYQNVWMKKRRDLWLSANGPCKLCGSNKQLEVDHINPKTKIHHAVWSWSEQRRNKELSKCQVLCKPCHQEKTKKDLNFPEHGYAAYKKGCRCRVCKDVIRDAKRRYRAKRKNLCLLP